MPREGAQTRSQGVCGRGRRWGARPRSCVALVRCLACWLGGPEQHSHVATASSHIASRSSGHRQKDRERGPEARGVGADRA